MYSLEDGECSGKHVPVDEANFRCTGIHSQQECCSPRPQAGKHSSEFTSSNKYTPTKTFMATVMNICSPLDTIKKSFTFFSFKG